MKALELLRLAATEGGAYDFVILDLMMPSMDGFEVARAIKSDPTTAATIIVMLISFGQRGDSTTARELGGSAYLTKPVRQAQLFECLVRVAAQRWSGIEASLANSKPDLQTKHALAEMRAVAKDRILLAEDNIINQKVAVRHLEKLGYRADVVAKRARRCCRRREGSL